jgi:hypothetical protein
MNPANYIPSCGRYLYINWYYPKITDLTLTGYQAQTIWTVYEAPAPWGPWTQVQSKTWNVAGALGLYNPNIIHKSISTDNGHTVMIATTGDFANQNNQTGDYTLHLVPGVVNN